MRHTAEYMLDTCELPDKSVLARVSRYDAAETLNLPDRWPRSFSPSLTLCPKCGHELSQLSKKKQTRLISIVSKPIKIGVVVIVIAVVAVFI